jgi:hypothetical protein
LEVEAAVQVNLLRQVEDRGAVVVPQSAAVVVQVLLDKEIMAEVMHTVPTRTVAVVEAGLVP